MTLSPIEEREIHRRELRLSIAKCERSIDGIQAELRYFQNCLEIERRHLESLQQFSREQRMADADLEKTE